LRSCRINVLRLRATSSRHRRFNCKFSSAAAQRADSCTRMQICCASSVHVLSGRHRRGAGWFACTLRGGSFPNLAEPGAAGPQIPSIWFARVAGRSTCWLAGCMFSDPAGLRTYSRQTKPDPCAVRTSTDASNPLVLGSGSNQFNTFIYHAPSQGIQASSKLRRPNLNEVGKWSSLLYFGFNCPLSSWLSVCSINQSLLESL
jgi:hypothetical protein